jgi:biogenesis of lysosome-related organelles complex 1 subunit 2
MSEAKRLQKSISLVEAEARKSLGDYLESETRLQCESYIYLSELNHATAEAYDKMAIRAKQSLDSMQELQNSYKELEAASKQMQELDENIKTLEMAAAKLDIYSLELLRRFKSLPVSPERK